VIVAQNLLVLSMNQGTRWEFDDSRHRPEQHATAQVSLEVGLDEAQRLVLARGQGTMRLLLRNPSDATEVQNPPEITEAQLMDPARRADWLRRFALVERPPLPAVAPIAPEGTDALDAGAPAAQ
jgi:Flp pilus assembly protein CpaB